MADHNASFSSENDPPIQSNIVEKTTQADFPQDFAVESSPPACGRLRRFLACNPLYLISAALLLYSFYLISADRNFLKTEVGQLSFNLGSLQLYQLVVVITAVFLARRAIWYDSTLLAGLENLLLLVPFILISQAALIDSQLVWILCLGGGLLAFGRMSFLRRRISQLNFPPRLFWIGIFVLFVNAALPAIYRVLHESKVGTKPDWGAAYETNQYIWWLVVPLLCALSNAVPWSPSGANNFWPQRRWLPLGLFGLWLAGTGVHLYCLGYVYDFALRPELLAPALWTLGWTLYLKTDQLLPGQEERYKNALWVLPTIATLFAAPQPEKAVFLLLTAINMSIFGVLYKRRRIPLALHLGILSTVALVAGLPEAWARSLAPQFNRESFVWGAAVLYVLIWIAGSCDPKLGILGAVLAAVSVGYVTNQPHATHWAAQTGLAFLLAHSLRWIDSEAEGASLLRWLAALAWVVHSLAWTHLYEAGWRVCIVALSVVAVFIILRWFCKKWGPMAIPAASLLVLLSAPGHIAASQLESTPAGLLAVIGSFILFALGTLAALTKQRWKCS